MGGNIGVDSQPGNSSTFWIELPSDTLHTKQKLATAKESLTEQIISAKLDGEQTVLYIEDNPANLRLVNQLLGRHPNIQMWSAHEAMLGLELAQVHHPNLILLDINLPGMSGYEVLKKLQKSEVSRDIPVIAISANAMPIDIEKGLAAGFNDYITKPIDVKALLQTVEKVLQG